MPAFMRSFPFSQNLHVANKDTPSLKHTPSTISSASRSSLSISIRSRVSSIASKFHLRRSRTLSSKSAIQHISNVPWPRSPSRSPSPPSPDIRPPSGLGRRASSISDFEMPNVDSPVSPRGSSFPKSANPSTTPVVVVRPDSAASFTSSHHSRRARSLSSPALLGSVNEFPESRAPVVLSTAQEFEPRTPRHARRQARQNPPIPLSLVLAHISRVHLPALALVSKRFCSAAQLSLYRTPELTPTSTDACIATLASAPHLAALVTSLALPTYPPTPSASFQLALALALRSMRALDALTLPTFDSDLLGALPPSAPLTRLTLTADTLPFAFFDRFLVARPDITHLALPNFVGVPPGAREVPPAAVPDLAALDASPGLAAALAKGRSLRRVTLRVASTLYDGLRPAALFDALGGELRELALVLAPDVDARTRGRLLGALAKTGAELEVLEVDLEGKSDEVTLQVLYKQVGMLLPNVRALHTLRLRAVRTASAQTQTSAEAEEGPARLAVWTRPPLGSTLRRIVFPSGSRWELERGEWVRVN
ncbi:hypothetical protein BC827DRAFT_1224360 [Russula dissimulans]|nr:hypothetical protein BC827DRAFT_1224360 [Russula dissimulans]